MREMNSVNGERYSLSWDKITLERRWGWLVSRLQRTRIKLRNYWLLTHVVCRQASHWSTLPQLASDWSRVSAARRARGARHGPSVLGSALQRIMRRNSGQSSAGPGHCDTELLRVRKIRVLCFSLQKRTTKIGQKTAGCQSRLTRALVNHWARIIWNNCNLTALWCTPFPSLATHFKVG